MTYDLLRDAARAVRDDTGERSPVVASTTRARVLGTVRRRRTLRLRLVRIVVPLAAILVASTTWAAATGRLHHAIAFVLAPPAETAIAAPAGVGVTRALGRAVAHASEDAPVERSAAIAEPPVVEAPVAPPPPTGSAPAAAAPTHVRSEASASASASASAPAAQSPSAAPREDDPEIHALYTAAHHSHFAARDWPAALAGWDAYLRAAPRGRFAVEARYNRALCLARMNRTAEARAALEPFARGGAGGYRQAEARALLDAMEAKP